MNAPCTCQHRSRFLSRLARGTAVGVMLFAAGCLGNDDSACGIPATTATPGGGLFPINQDQRIILQADRPATIFFTLDGTPPKREAADCANGPTFCGAAPISNIPIAFNGMVLKYFAVDRCGNQEQAKSATYRLDTAPRTTVTPPPGTFNTPVTVTFIAADESTGATVFFTTDGSEPIPGGGGSTDSGNSPTQTQLLASTQLKWFAVDASGNRENTKAGEYIIDTTPPISTADPSGSESGSFASPLDVTIRIANDTGNLFITDNGAVPDLIDPQHTISVPLQRTFTLNQSTVLRFTSIDKAGNREHPAGGFNQEVYILDDVPLVFATPPGGDFASETLTVELTAFPGESQIFFSLNGAPDVLYDPASPIVLMGTVNTLAFYADNPNDILPPSPTKTATYNLGVAGETLDVTVDFSNAAQIDSANTTADIDTAGGVVRLPTDPVVLEDQLTTTTIQPGEALDYTQAARTDGISLFSIDGVFTGAGESGGPNAPGLKIFNNATTPLSGMNPPTPLFRSTFTDATRPQFYALDLLCPNGVCLTLQLVALATVQSGTGAPGTGPAQILFVNATDVDNPVAYAGIDIDVVDVFLPFGGPPVARPPLLTQTVKSNNALFASSRNAGFGTMTNEIAAITVDTATQTATVRGTVTLSSGAAGFGAQVVGLGFADAGQNVVLALTQDCDVLSVDFSLIDAPVTTVVTAFANVCGLATAPQATHLEVFTFGSVRYALATYLDTANGDVNATLMSFDSLGATAIAEDILPTGQAPTGVQAQVWDAALLFAGATEQPVLALSGGATGLWFYDFQDVIDAGGVANLGTLSLLQRGTEDGVAVDGIVAISPATTNDDFVMAAKWQTNAQGGGVSTWRVPDTLRERTSSGVIQTANINPQPGDTIVQVMYEAIDITPASADIDVEYWDGDEFKLIALGQTKAMDPPSNEFKLRITLRDTNGDPVLDAITFRLDTAP